MQIITCTHKDGEILACLRDRAMRESLENVGRYDPIRVKQRFLSNFNPQNTKKILVGDKLVGFFVALELEDHIYLDHLYIDPDHQSQNIGSTILKEVKSLSKKTNKPIRLGALIQSKANQFYIANGFKETHQGEHDIYYEFSEAN